MEREKVNVFDSGRLPAPSGEAVRPSGGTAVRVMAFGMAVFSVIFLLCCLGVSLREQPTGPDSPELSQQCGAVTDVGGVTGTTAGEVPSEPSDTATDTVTDSASPTVTDIYAYDASAVPHGHVGIRPYDLSLSAYGDSFMYNSTSYSPSIAALLRLDTRPTIEDTASAPVVLIIHTHGTEAYSPEGSVSYDGVSTLARSSDVTQNVVAVGRVMAEVLNRNGINTLHCEIMHDEQSYRDSYSRSAATVREYLRKYPSIKYVFDVHRDSVTDGSGALLRPVTASGAGVAAQVMCVVGSDEGGADYPNWQQNLAFALRLRSAMNADCAGLARPVCLRSSAYNQQYAPMSLLLEVGCSGNYLSEALEAGRLCAQALADLIKG